MFVLGIDPGLSRCGYGAIVREGRELRAVAAGVITTDPGDELPRRLAQLQLEVRSLLAEHDPHVVAIERVLFQNNVRTAMSVGHASGVVMAEAAGRGCDVVLYSPNEVKAAVTGVGDADKAQVARMVQGLLGIAQALRPVDASDALAIALCHFARVPGGGGLRLARRVTQQPNTTSSGARA